MIKIGPAGLGGVKEAEKNLEFYSDSGFKLCEIAFTYRVYIKREKDARRIGEKAKHLGIKLSIHTPYWSNLNSDDKKKVEASKKRILDSCEVAKWLGAEKVIFHCGYYGIDKEKAFENIKLRILEMQEKIKNKWDVELCPEIMGKKNVFGSIDEIARLVKETGCGFCIDFAHILARYNNYEFDLIKRSFPAKKWHCHFSGIDYTEKGERRHKMAGISEWKKFLKGISKDKDIDIICESPESVKDCLFGLQVLNF